MKAIADAGFLVAAWNRRDAHHTWAAGIAKSVDEPLITCEPVLAEVAFHLHDVRVMLGFVHDGLVRLAFQAAEHLDQLSELAERYADQSPDFADLCLIRMSELYPDFPVITTDVTDFRVYRRFRRERIPLLHPPGL